MNNLSKYNETIATRAAGISIFRMMVPLMIMGLFICGLIAFFGEYVLPIAENKRTIIFNVNIRQREVEDIKMRSNIFYSDDKYIYYLGFFDGYQNRIRVVDITQRDENNLIVRKIQANEAIWIDDHIYPDTKVWNFINVYDRHFSEGELLAYTFFDEKTFPEVTVTPQDFIKSAKKPMEMNYIELRDYINRLKKIGDKSHREETDLHYKISFPLANFIILLFCVPLATASIRSKGRGMIFLMGILICFAYLMVIRLCLSLGYSEIITPLQAAWAPHILFFLVGVFFVIKAEI
jgi:lipopolysaccharide export system permease protein